jgi:hypothetical protein
MRSTVRGVVTVQARPGEWLVVHGRVTDAPERIGEIVEVPHGDGSPPYVVRWRGADHTCVVFPGPDAGVVAEPPATAHHG